MGREDIRCDSDEEMKEQFEVDNHFLMYIEQDGKIIAGITAKDMNKNSKKITLSILAVSNSERKKGLARELVLEFEKRCKIKKIKYIELGARFRACSFYEKLSYNYCLMIQVFDFSTIEDVRNKNKYNFEEISSFQGETYGCICFKVPSIKKEYIDYFEKNVKTAYAQYIFKKEL